MLREKILLREIETTEKYLEWKREIGEFEEKIKRKASLNKKNDGKVFVDEKTDEMELE